MIKKKNKVCIVTTIPFAIKFLLLDQIKGLQKEGYRVSVVCSPGKWIRDIELEEIKVRQILMKRKISPISDLVAIFKLTKYFRKEKFNIVHTSTPKAGFIGTLAAKLAGVDNIIHSNLGFYFRPDSFWPKKFLFTTIERMIGWSANIVFSVAKPDIDRAIEEHIYPEKKIRYMGWMIDTNKFNPTRFNKEFILAKKKKLGIRQGYKVIGINARLVRDKGYYELFKAFRNIIAKFPNTMLMIIGPEEPEKPDKINPETIFADFGIEENVLYLKERTDADELYSLMDIFILPSYREGIAVSVLEALAMEVPTIGTDVGGIPDSIEDGVTGKLISSKSAKEIEIALKYFLENPEIVREYGKRGRRKIAEFFDKKIVFERIRKEYEKMSKIKICHVASSSITPKFMIADKLRFLQKKGYEVSVVCSPGKWVKDIEREGIKVKTIKIKRKISPLSDLVAIFKLYSHFKHERFDIIHTHTPKPDFLGQITAWLARTPIIINTIHGFNFVEGDTSLKQRMFLSLQRLSGKCSDLVFSISSFVTETAVKQRIVRREIIEYLGRDIDTERFNPRLFDEGFINKKKKELKITGMTIGIVARLVADKGFYELFESFREILKEYPDLKLIIIGPDELEKKNRISMDDVKRFGIEDNVIFLGERTDVEEIYPLMDIFVLPTHREGLGAAILEASAMEIPVIVSNTGGCPEAVDDNRTGILVPVKDVISLTKAMRYLLENREVRLKMGKAGRKKILAEYRKDIVLKRMNDNYERLIENNLKEN